MQNRQIILLLVGVLFIAGIYSLMVMPKQEMPEYVIRQGVVVGVYPGANAQEVEEQLTKPLERYLFTYTEVKRAKTTSKTEDGITYIFVELADEVSDKNVVWSKIKHGLGQFKSSLPTGVLAVIANDNFGDVSSLLITLESEDKTYREIDGYCDALEDRLRTVPTVANVRRYGSQQEQITVYVDNEKLSAYGIGSKMLMANLMAQGLTITSGTLENSQAVTPIHIAETFHSEQEIANQVIFSTPQGDVVRTKDVGRVVREYPKPDSYITHNGRKCVLLSVEVNPKANIISFGTEVNEVLDKFKSELPESVNINRIVEQPKAVAESINHFLVELLIAILAVVLVTMILLPFRVAAVAATSIPITIGITLAVFYVAGIPLNMITLAALIVVLGMIVDNSIVVVDSYIDKLDSGKDRWESTIRSAQEYFKSILSATLAISITFFPLLFTTTGTIHDFLIHFPWAIGITLIISLIVAMLVIPIIQYFLIKKGLKPPLTPPQGENSSSPVGRLGGASILDYVQSAYEWLLAKVFAYPKTTLLIALASVVVGGLIFMSIPQRMMPIAERDQFAVEIYLPKGSPLEKTAAVCDSLEYILRADERVKSVSAFIGTSSPRFHAVYAPNMPSKVYGQFIVNTVSNEATEEMMDDYANRYAYYFPEAYIRFKQLDFQAVDAPIEVRLIGENIDSLKVQAEKVENYLQSLDECLWIRTSFDAPVQGAKIELDPDETSRLGINKTLVALGISSGLTGMKITDLWENNYAMPVCIEPAPSNSPEGGESSSPLGRLGGATISSLENVQISGLLGAAVPLRQIAKITPEWNESVITHRNGLRTLSVLADVKRGEYANKVFAKVAKYVDSEIAPQLPDGVEYAYGGLGEFEDETMSPMYLAMVISFIMMFFILVFHFRKIKMAVIIMLASSLSIFGAAFGVWILRIDFNAFAILGIIGLVGIIIRNGIIMFDYIEFLRFTRNESVRQAAFDAGKRRMRPIFLTSACASMGVLPMIISASPMWAGMATIIFFGTLISMVLIVTVLPVVYWLVYRKQDEI
ncbi:MAG: Cobalt-zinc-cadmium resistance protein CzcA [Candidatus Ordinivivax streblomastigis]|uniref:Cobalt-zinc-cadmium resistance protein CzcA n=1 Tax=Candidatus Ordinivivax streblomastigis TaxID=2540710 RepID=A0A5M8NZV2_9BACT|nr:MAG: Cobalt-zinc-cadmium resistance protein CzcA [Candidatus Ordinivivax streblomastigis]